MPTPFDDASTGFDAATPFDGATTGTPSSGDTATGTDAATNIRLSHADTATGTDTGTVGTPNPSSSDTVHATESESISGTIVRGPDAPYPPTVPWAPTIEFGFTTNALGLVSTWTDVTAKVRALSTIRGRSQPLTAFGPGKATIVLDNTDARFDPDNTAGPYYGHLVPMIQVRISFKDSTNTACYIFYGYVQPRDGWHNDYTPGPTGSGDGNATTTVTCVDFLYILSTKKAPLVDPPTMGGTVINSVVSTLVSAGTIPRPGHVAWKYLGGSANYTTMRISGYAGNASVLQILQSLADTDYGAVYVLATGQPALELRFAPLAETTMTTPQAVFDASGATGESFSTVGFEKTFANDLYNSITVQANGLADVLEQDTTGVTQYTELAFSVSTWNETLADSFANADIILDGYKTPLPSPVSVTLNPRHDLQTLDDALHLDLHYRATIKYRPPGMAATASTDVLIEQIEHRWDIGGTWTTTYVLANVAHVALVAWSSYFQIGTDKPDGTKQLAY